MNRRSTRQRAGLALAAAVLLVVAGLALNSVYRDLKSERPSPPPRPAQSLIGQPRPAFSLPDLAGGERHIDDWRGGVVVLNFWATWCAPCRRELPMLRELQAELAPRGAQFIGVAIDKRADVEQFLAELDLEVNYPILIGQDEAIAVATLYGNTLGVLPYTVVIDRAGRIADARYGEMEREYLAQLLDRFL